MRVTSLLRLHSLQLYWVRSNWTYLSCFHWIFFIHNHLTSASKMTELIALKCFSKKLVNVASIFILNNYLFLTYSITLLKHLKNNAAWTRVATICDLQDHSQGCLWRPCWMTAPAIAPAIAHETAERWADSWHEGSLVTWISPFCRDVMTLTPCVHRDE